MGQSVWVAFRQLHQAGWARSELQMASRRSRDPNWRETFWLWRAVDANGDVLDILVQSQRNAKAARRFLQRLIDRFDDPRVVVTDKLRSDIKPIRNLAGGADHGAHKGLNNRIEGSHRPTRKREKLMGRFKSPRQAQRFLTSHDQINCVFCPIVTKCQPIITVNPEPTPFQFGARTRLKWTPDRARADNINARVQHVGNASQTISPLCIVRLQNKKFS